MCVYCYCGDHLYTHDPWFPNPVPMYPQPVAPYNPLPHDLEIAKLKEKLNLLRQIKELEDRAGCPCDGPEQGKPDYIGDLQTRIKTLEKT